MMLYVATVLILATIPAIRSGYVEVIFPSLYTSRSGEKILKFHAFDEDVVLRLEPAGDVLPDDFSIEDSDRKYPVDVASIKRKLYKDENKVAALYIDEDGPITINGMIGSRMRIEPVHSGQREDDGKTAHRIIKLLPSKKYSYNDGIISLKNTENLKMKINSRQGEDPCVVIKYVIITEGNFTAAFENKNELTSYLTTKVVYTGIQLNTLKLRINVNLIKIIMLNGGSDSQFIQKSYLEGHDTVIHPDNLVDNAGDYVCGLNNPEIKEATMFFVFVKGSFGIIKEDGTFFDGILGVANLGNVCDRCKNVGAVLDSANNVEDAGSLAHETCHLLGSDHDDEPPAIPGSPGSKECPGKWGYIMGDQTGQNETIFSECSRRNVQYFLTLPRSDCVKIEC